MLSQFIYMCSELTSVNYVVNGLTGLDGLAATIVEVVITLLYTGNTYLNQSISFLKPYLL